MFKEFALYLVKGLGLGVGFSATMMVVFFILHALNIFPSQVQHGHIAAINAPADSPANMEQSPAKQLKLAASSVSSSPSKATQSAFSSQPKNIKKPLNSNIEIPPPVKATSHPPRPDWTKVEHRVVDREWRLLQAVDFANKGKGPKVIVLEPRTYNMHKTIGIKGEGIQLLSKSGNPADTIINGKGMRRSDRVENLIRVTGSNFMLDGITLANTGNHLLQIAGERDADGAVLRNCVFRDAYEQLLKVSWDRVTDIAADNGLIENCVFEYTKGIGPNFYIGGVDIHSGDNWIIRDNVFKNIASPGKHVAEHAVHFWNRTNNTLVERNLIINCDRGIGFGLKGKVNYGGIIRENLIVHADNGHPYADVGIVVEDSPNTQIIGNKIYFEHPYDNAIEYRFPATTGVVIRDNITNKPITRRNGASATLTSNRRATDYKDIFTPEEIERIGFPL